MPQTDSTIVPIRLDDETLFTLQSYACRHSVTVTQAAAHLVYAGLTKWRQPRPFFPYYWENHPND